VVIINENMSFMGMNELLDKLKNGIDRLDSGTLAVSELEELTEVSRELYERLVVLRYKAYDDSIKAQEAIISEPEIINQMEIIEYIHESQPEIQEYIEENLSEAPTEERVPLFAFNITEIQEVQEEIVTESLGKEMQAPLAFVQAPKPSPKIDSTSLGSINDKLAKEESSLADRLGKSRIEDLRKAIGINQKFGFISGLFSGDSSAYDLTIDRFNSATDIDEAMSLFAEEQQARSWDAEESLVESLINLIERRHV